VKHTISVARDFSTHPGPRYIRQGSWSGEKFRKLLEERLRRHEQIVVDLDGTRGYGSSFLDEAFGGLVRECILTRDEFLRRIEIRSEEDPTYREEALDAVRKAEPRQ
jgi:hypothetical protein